MISAFRSQQPTAIALFILLFLFVKLPFVLMDAPSMLPLQNVWFRAAYIPAAHPVVAFLMAQLCLLGFAVWFNYLFHQADYHEGSTMLPAVYFTLVSSLLPAFNFFSIYHVVVLLCLLLFQVLLQINSMESARAESYNAGFIAGGILLLFPGFWLFLPFLFVILYVLKPFRFNEFLLLLLGVLTPLYLGAGIAYLADAEWDASVFWTTLFYRFDAHVDPLNLTVLILAGAYLLFSFISLRGILFSVGFRRRKNVNMIVWYFLGILAVLGGNMLLGLPLLALAWLPVSVFLTLLLLRIRRKKVPDILHAAFVLTIFIINILRIAR